MARLAQEAEGEGDKALAGRMYAELANYTAPKRKAIEKETVVEPLTMAQAIEEVSALLKPSSFMSRVSTKASITRTG